MKGRGLRGWSGIALAAPPSGLFSVDRILTPTPFLSLAGVSLFRNYGNYGGITEITETVHSIYLTRLRRRIRIKCTGLYSGERRECGVLEPRLIVRDRWAEGGQNHVGS